MARSPLGRWLGPIVATLVALAGAGYGCGSSGGGAGPGAAGSGGSAVGGGGRGGAAGAVGGNAGAGATGGAAGSGGGGAAGTGGSAGSGGSAGASGGSAGTGGSAGSRGGGGGGGSGGAAGTGGSAAGAGAGGAGTGGSAGTGAAGGGAGTGGAAGSAGTGGIAGTGGTGGCTPTGAEDCFNGVDDDCNGDIDCADSACQPIAECVPDATGFQLGTTVDAAAACPPHYGAGTTTLNQGLNAPATCTGCSATPSLTCTTNVQPISTCPGGTATDSVAISSATCNNSDGPGYNNLTTGAVHIGPYVAVGMCFASGTPAPTPVSWQVQTKFCAAQGVGGGCQTGFRCVARIAVADKHCVAVPGSMACPGNYAAVGAQPWYAGVQDGRTCGATCNYTPSGASCGTSIVRLYPSSNCTGLSDAAAANADTCGLGLALRSAAIQMMNTTPPTCSLTNTASGAAVANSPETLCCL